MGRWARAVNRSPLSFLILTRASLITGANAAALSGVSRLVPGQVKVMTCMSTPASSRTWVR